MVTKLFVGSLAYSVTGDQLQELFSQVGKVVSCNLIMDKFSGQSKGFAFVEMSTDEEAREAINKFNNFELNERKIVVNIARPKENNFRRDNFSGRSFSRDQRR